MPRKLVACLKIKECLRGTGACLHLDSCAGKQLGWDEMFYFGKVIIKAFSSPQS